MIDFIKIHWKRELNDTLRTKGEGPPSLFKSPSRVRGA